MIWGSDSCAPVLAGASASSRAPAGGADEIGDRAAARDPNQLLTVIFRGFLKSHYLLDFIGSGGPLPPIPPTK